MESRNLTGRTPVAGLLALMLAVVTPVPAFPAQAEAGSSISPYTPPGHTWTRSLNWFAGFDDGGALLVHKGKVGATRHSLLNCPEDVNGSGNVDTLDVQLVAGHWNTALGGPGYDPIYDVAVPLDQRVDIRDVQAVSALWGQACPLNAQPSRVWTKPQSPALTEAGAISTGSGVQVWNGHNCPANVPVNIVGLSAGLGGYETQVGWDPARFGSAPADVTVNIGTYATNGGTRQQSGDSGTPELKAVSAGALKYGAYSWGAGNPPGNQANGQLATISIKPTATCGSTGLTMTGTQLIDTSGNLIALTAQTGSPVAVFSRYDVSGGGALINSRDVNAVVAKLGQAVGGSCGANYRYDVSVSGPLIDSADVSAVVARLNQSVNAACAP